MSLPKLIINDGGRSAAGFKGAAKDCAVRAIAIVTGADYKTVYSALRVIATDWKGRGKRAQRIRSNPSPRNGVYNEVVDSYMQSHGYRKVMVNRRLDDLPNVDGVLSIRKHIVAFVNGAIHDTYDSRMTSHFVKQCPITGEQEHILPRPYLVTCMWVQDK